MPSWHSNSTVGNSQNVDYVKDELDGDSTNNIQDNGETKVKSENDDNNNGVAIKEEGTSEVEDGNGTEMSSVLPTPEPVSSTVPQLSSFSNNNNVAAPTSTTHTDLKDQEAQNALAEYYAQLAEQEGDDDDDDEDDDDDDDDDEDEFDDLI